VEDVEEIGEEEGAEGEVKIEGSSPESDQLDALSNKMYGE